MMPPELDHSLLETPQAVVVLTASIPRPWWLIGSAAIALYGVNLDVADVDLQLAPQDAMKLLRENHGARLDDGGNERFRSEVFGRIEIGPLPIDVLGGFQVVRNGRWEAVEPATRVAIPTPVGHIFVPARLELAAITRSLGRPKDLARARMLDALT